VGGVAARSGGGLLVVTGLVTVTAVLFVLTVAKKTPRQQQQ
jgi:hypothetical protein